MASPYLITFAENNTLGSIGSYRIVCYSEAFKYVRQVTSLLDQVTGETSSYSVQRSFRWSRDGINWSLWIVYMPDNSSPADTSPVTSLLFDPEEDLWIELKFQVIDSSASPELENGTPISPEITIDMVDLRLELVLPDPFAGYPGPPRGLCSNEFLIKPIVFQESKFTFNPYDVNAGVNLYKDLSNMVNNMFGHDVVYYRIVPQRRSRDIVLKEWTIYNVQQEICMKILVPNNQFPDSKFNFNQFGIDFEQPFEVHVDRTYWESFFGKGTMPQQRDIIYFPLTQRVYEIQSSYAFRDFMNQVLYYKISLVKYQPKADTIVPDDIQSTLDDLTISTEELFGEEMQEQIERHTKPQQYITITHDQDPIRERVLRSLPITKFTMYNNWTLVAEHYYDMLQSFIANDGAVLEAVTYRVDAKMSAQENRAFTCWFSPQTNTKTSSAIRPLISGRNASGIGVDIDLSYSSNTSTPSQILLTINSDIYSFNLQKPLEKDKWYALVVNWSSEFKQASVDVWTMQQATSQLARLSHEVKVINSFSYDSVVRYKLKTSALFLTNIRVFDSMIEDEHQNLVLNQLVVKDSQKAIIIDNAKPLLRLAKIANPK